MPSRRAQIQMTDQEQKKFLADGWTLQIASIGPNGWPHLIAMWYAVIDGLIHFTTFTKSQKILNLQRDPRVTCMLEQGDKYEELQGLVIEGEAEVISDDPDLTLRVLQHTGAKYRGSPIDAPLDADRRRLAAKRAVVRVHPKRVYSWDHRKLSGRY